MRYRPLVSVLGFALIVCLTGSLHAQTSQDIKSLETSLATAEGIIETLDLYDQLVGAFIYSDLQKAQAYNDSLLHLALDHSSQNHIVRHHLHQGVIERNHGNFVTADSLFDLSLKLAPDLDDPKLVLLANYQKGAHLHFLEQREESLTYLF